MDLFIQGKGPVRLEPSDFVAQGGEGSVYARDDLAFKLYTDPSKMIPAAKLRELAVLSDPRIIRPQDVLLDRGNRPVGYTMRRVKDPVPLCRLFTRAFRERHGISPDRLAALVRRLQDGVRHVHTHDILIVDLNEMNFLLDAGLQDVLFIDVDSYQTPHFPATALMESIRDRHASRFSRETDWFSFAVVSFQMFSGIHPYKGKHPTLGDLDARMQANVSVLNPQVKVPQVCYPFDAIPQAYREWYRALFEEGKRLPPPADLRPVITVAPAVQHLQGDRIRLRELYRFPAEIVSLVPTGGAYAALTTEGLYLGARKYPAGPGVRIGFTPRLRHAVAAWIEGRTLVLYDLTASRRLDGELEAEALTTCDGRFYVKCGASLHEVEFLELPAGTRAALRPVGNAMENATQLFDGCAVQSMLGTWHVSVFPQAGACHCLRVPELVGCQVVDARFENHVLMVVGARNGRYDRFVLRFDRGFAGYDVRRVPDVPYCGLNFTVLDNGVCLHVNEDEALELFSHRKGSTGVRLIGDPAVPGVRVSKDGTQALFSRGPVVYSATLI